jgi:hypothetical protein
MKVGEKSRRARNTKKKYKQNNHTPFRDFISCGRAFFIFHKEGVIAMADTATVRDITDKLENGVKELMKSDKYTEYLKTMSRFHKYSTRNTILIHLQSPEAKRVGGFRFRQQEFNRHVKKGEHCIKIFAPVSNKGKDNS